MKMANADISFFPLKKALNLVPERLSGRALFWGVLPLFLFLLTSGVSFFSTSFFSPLIPFASLVGTLVCMRWRAIGLYSCYVALALLALFFFREMPHAVGLWQGGVIFSLAVDFFILLLVVEEIETREEGREKEIRLLQLQSSQAAKEWNELKESFEKEIERLKQEAEQRVIEKRKEGELIELIQSEITLLNSQKNAILAEAKRALSQEPRIIYKEDEERVLRLGEELTELRISLEATQSQLSEKSVCLERVEADKADRLLQLERIQAQLTEKSALLEKAQAQVQAQAKERVSQLEAIQAQLGEKSALLEEMQSEWMKVQTQAKEQQVEREERLSQLEAIQAQLSEKSAHLERAERDCAMAQEQLLLLQQTPPAESPVDTRHLEGMYTQLRAQFDEKSATLSQTRKELFQIQSKLLAKEQDERLAALSNESSESAYFERELHEVILEVEQMEEEICKLEELVAQGFSFP